MDEHESKEGLRKLEGELSDAIARLTDLKKDPNYETLMQLVRAQLLTADTQQYQVTDPNQILMLQGEKRGYRRACSLVDLKLDEMHRRLDAVQLKLSREQEGDALGGH